MEYHDDTHFLYKKPLYKKLDLYWLFCEDEWNIDCNVGVPTHIFLCGAGLCRSVRQECILCCSRRNDDMLANTHLNNDKEFPKEILTFSIPWIVHRFNKFLGIVFVNPLNHEIEGETFLKEDRLLKFIWTDKIEKNEDMRMKLSETVKILNY